MLFHNIPKTEQCITRRHKEWVRLFHSDKHRANPVFDELMKHINSTRDRHLSKVHSLCAKSIVVQNEIDEGHKHAELSMTFKKRFKSGGDEELNVEQLEKLFTFEALTAFEHYRAALKSLGKMAHNEADILQRAQILEWMALVMRLSGKHNIEAQLYIVAAIYIITLLGMTEQLYQRLRKLQIALEKYQGLARNTITEMDAAASSNTNRELILCTNPKLSSREIHDETQVFIREAILRKCVVRSAQIVDLSVENQFGVDSSFQTSTGRYLQVRGILASAFLPLAAEFIIAGGSWMWNKIVFKNDQNRSSVQDLSDEYPIRLSLNKLMEDAVKFYNNEEYAKFIQHLSKSYYQDRQLMDTKLGSETISVEIRVDQLIRPLLKHGFRADKIAHLLILIGEVLLRGIDFADPTRKNPEHTALLEQSKILFQGVYDSEQLSKAAVQLDERVQKYHQLKITKAAKKILASVSEKDIEDSHEAPYSDRLAGYCKLARLNYAIACLLAGGKDNFERCKQSLKILKSSENTYHDRFFVIPDERIQALEDLLSAFGMDDDNTNLANPSGMCTIASNITVDVKNIRYLKTDLGYRACNFVEEVDANSDQLIMLPCLVPGELGFNCEMFIQYVSEKYSSSDQLILELLHQERVSNLSEWAIKFRSNKKIFQHRAYLPLLSAFGNIKIQPCDIIQDEQYGIVFEASHPVIDYVPGRSGLRELFVVVRGEQDHISCLFTLVPIEITHLQWQLNNTPENHPERAVILLRIAEHYMNEAHQNDKQNHLAALIDWQKAQDYYAQVLSVKEVATKQHLASAELGYCKCLLKQHRYSRINERLSSGDRSWSADVWLVYAQAQRNIGEYKIAKYGIQQAIRLEPLNCEVRREEKAIKMKDERIQVNERLDLSYNFPGRSNEKPFYNILSIDGGGIRGVIPAIWLMALEHKIKRPISSLFHVVAGTSTGAIIAAGLTTPSLEDPSKPYQAYELVQLYRAKAEQVFSRNPSFLSRVRASLLQESKYVDEGRHMLFYEYFGGSKLSNTLSELVIPVVKSGSNATDIFTRRASRRDLTEDSLLTEILMCTTAAPTYFPPYRLKNTVYIDGGIQANNPSMIAYDHILDIYPNCDKNRIRLLSLGTGDYVPDPLNPDAGRNLLFWARNYQSVLKVLMDGPQNNIDLHLHRTLGSNYYRWQIWLENPIELFERQASTD
ncbi:unnamed protein product [Didymodactylos carnosus]|uniref:PNPLA domain-containing protein n=1 Tax=Didymodactylos carnosus TaxID=1234261 RepID=A0A8S2HBG2_9BILA|nr:unnamed protein product [Didymodactylos carnosus]CAF3626466.1 unnamed protein product [Didymodactylos carnosus]